MEILKSILYFPCLYPLISRTSRFWWFSCSKFKPLLFFHVTDVGVAQNEDMEDERVRSMRILQSVVWWGRGNVRLSRFIRCRTDDTDTRRNQLTKHLWQLVQNNVLSDLGKCKDYANQTSMDIRSSRRYMFVRIQRFDLQSEYTNLSTNRTTVLLSTTRSFRHTLHIVRHKRFTKLQTGLQQF